MLSPENLRRVIKDVELFDGVAAHDVTKIFSRGQSMNVQKDQVIFHEGTTGNQMFIVMGGKVGILKSKKCIAQLTTGDMFGEMALVSQDKRTATAVALENTSLFVLDETIFEKIMTKRIAIRILLNIIRTLCRRLVEANKRLTDS